MSTAKEIASGSLYSATEKAQTAKMPIKQSTPVQRYIVGPAVYVKECLAVVSAMVFRVSKDNVVMSKFTVHPPSLRSALLTGASVGLVSMLVTLFVPPAFGYLRVHVARARTAHKKEHKGSGSAPAPISDVRSSSSTPGPFEAYRKQAGRTGTGGGCRHPRHGSNATAEAVAEALAASKKHSDKED
ncbi:hypothetical protein BGZ97_000950 [Linnemannia gamsii]|uniref:Uncharacterized protein n=1 Tax=Linnemannia gamsii TaxID=64522 RepID=A0A9P6QXM1_9FUNG|nr:hypothetical protein BGZ97_000950 [Linnemannia gamsii]